MSKLGYTWYPKDWGNSDSVFELSLSERGLYREFIDLAMLNNNTTEIKKEVWIRKFCLSETELNTIVKKLINLKLIEIKGTILFVPSCENRLKLVRAGSDGGKKSKPIVKPLGKPTPKPLVKPYSKPLVKQREKEIEMQYKYGVLIFGWGSCSGCDPWEDAGDEDVGLASLRCPTQRTRGSPGVPAVAARPAADQLHDVGVSDDSKW